MPTVTVERRISAPADFVFDAISNIENLPNTVAGIKSVQFLTDQRSDVGTRFRETREMGGTEYITELEVVEYQPENRSWRGVADTDGTIWDSVMRVEAHGDQALLIVEMDCRGKTWFKRMLNVLLKGLYRRGLVDHLDAVKAYCERSAMQQSKSKVVQPS